MLSISSSAVVTYPRFRPMRIRCPTLVFRPLLGDLSAHNAPATVPGAGGRPGSPPDRPCRCRDRRSGVDRFADMDSRRVGRSGLEVSRLGLGTMTWGRDTDADAAAAELEAFVGAGGTLIDTANIYGDGDAESIIGTLVPDVVSRSSVVLATTSVGVGGGRGRLLAALDSSLQRLGTDHVDLWQVHGFDPAVPFEETCSALASAVASGRAGYVGVSGMTGWQIATLSSWLRASSPGSGLVSVQAEYSLLDRSVEQTVLPAAAAHGLGLLAWAALGRGVLTGKYRHGTPADSRGASPHFTRYVGRYRTE